LTGTNEPKMLEGLFGDHLFKIIELWPEIFETFNSPEYSKVRKAVLV